MSSSLAQFDFNRIKIINIPKHVRIGMIKLRKIVQKADFLIEVRDARIPITTACPKFEPLILRKPRIIIYNKMDLADGSFNKVI